MYRFWHFKEVRGVSFSPVDIYSWNIIWGETGKVSSLYAASSVKSFSCADFYVVILLGKNILLFFYLGNSFVTLLCLRRNQQFLPFIHKNRKAPSGVNAHLFIPNRAKLHFPELFVYQLSM